VRRTAIFGLIVVLAVTLIGVYRMPKSVDPDPDVNRKNSVLKIVTRVKSGRTESVRIGTTQVDVNDETTKIDFPGTDANHVRVRLSPSVKFNNDHLDGTFWVTINAEEPVILTKTNFEKIQTGMTYAQVGEALGGVMTKGRMSDGFWSKVELIQGKRRIYLTFADGKVTKKSAENLE
jgi:hypothetical protein